MPPEKERILVIEDNEDMLAFMQETLVKEGYIVDTANTGELGLEDRKNKGYIGL